ncbi:DASS family sodium-coupled anion symporter [Aeoliella mucimassa]|uniref:Malate transporter YflS n=1 Tax=Aeoliella mucimassa TaxID=2527972 RepID=A0A518ANJ6_9BACT|nr:DASS family sodium-coupled anion symporter [Aeoliella mucimassa]QDU56293.1 Putative malate transporter YflS [Aeoliella mucimassa]
MENAPDTGSSVDPLFALRLSVCLIVGAVMWFMPAPEGLNPAAWRTFAVFVATILSFLLRPLPMGASVLLGMLVLAGTGTIATTAQDDWMIKLGLHEDNLVQVSRSPSQPATLVEYHPNYDTKILIRETLVDKTYKQRAQESLEAVLSGFGHTTVWLVVAAFFISGAMIQSGLGRRIALMMVAKLGNTTLGLGYALAAAELVLAPFVPSNTARGGGLMMPIVDSMSKVLGSTPNESPRRAGEYLVLCGAHLNLITAAMFLTGMAANPLVSKAASDILQVEFGWGMWLKGSIVPGLISLGVVPWVLYRLAPPQLSDSHAAQEAVANELNEMGKWSRHQIIMGSVLMVMLFLWATGPIQELLLGGKLHATWVAMSGVLTLVVAGVLPYEKVTGNSSAWDTLLWLGGLVAMADALKATHFVDWFAEQVQANLGGITGIMAAVLLAVIYFYSMYGFSMLTGHILAFTGVFFAVAGDMSVPPLVMIALVAYFSNLCGCTTNYSTGPVVIYFGQGYVPIRRWFWIGFVMSLLHLLVWLGPGLLWWKLLGWW